MKSFFVAIILALAVLLNLFWGHSQMNEEIFFSFRLPKALTALAVGASLSLAGLLMQRVFKNPLAGPYTLGLQGGASLLVGGVLLLASKMELGFLMSREGISILSILGVLGSMSLLFLFFRKQMSSTSFLLFGVLLGFLSSGLLESLSLRADAHALKRFFHWGIGDFSRTYTWEALTLLLVVILTIFFLFKRSERYDLFSLGDFNATSEGVSKSSLIKESLFLCSLCVGGALALSGPIAFVGLMGPHLARLFHGVSRMKDQLILSSLWGGGLCLFSLFLSERIEGFLSLNTIFSICAIPFFFNFLQRRTSEWG